jgi:hypothetical protein
MPKIKIDEKEYKLLKKLQLNVDKWVDIDGGGKTIVIKRKKGTMVTDEETLYQDRFIRIINKLRVLNERNRLQKKK